MKINSKLKICSAALLSLCSSSVFAGTPNMMPYQPPVSVSEPSVLALLGIGVVVALFVAKRRKK